MKIGVYIGRFQPFHNSHLATVLFAASRVDHLIIVVGSAEAPRSIKNPWTAIERIAMIQATLPEYVRPHVHFVPVRDHHYNDNDWVVEVRNGVSNVAKQLTGEYIPEHVTLFGFEKDASSYYLKMFPQWHFVSTDNLGFPEQNASDVRNAMFNDAFDTMTDKVPLEVGMAVRAFLKTHCFQQLKDEYQHIQQYKQAWASAPYAPTFVTVDTLAIKSGHILVVRRKGQPGRGQIALPGGFIDANERIVDAAMRELREETGLRIASTDLKKMITNNRVFDYPSRSLRGRTITHAFCINLGTGELPKVKGSDDADKAWWMPIDELVNRQSEFFEDHYHIIQHFLGQGNRHMYY
jgi:bifunctional NMN adenylyltransferase/nudix hydrolase